MTRAHVSIWDLLCASQEHIWFMVEVLNKIVVSEDANPTIFIRSVQNEALQISFSKEELPTEGRNVYPSRGYGQEDVMCNGG